MENIQQMVDVNTIVGDPVETPDGSVIIPVSKVTCGFAAGGSDFHGHGNRFHRLEERKSRFAGAEEEQQSQANQQNQGNQGNQQDDQGCCGALPFGGGSGGGVSVQPVGFLVAGNGHLRLLPIEENANAVIDRLIDTAPGLVDRIIAACQKKSPEKKGHAEKDHTEKAH
jgi:sporulation protein YtfJ